MDSSHRLFLAGIVIALTATAALAAMLPAHPTHKILPQKIEPAAFLRGTRPQFAAFAPGDPAFLFPANMPAFASMVGLSADMDRLMAVMDRQMAQSVGDDEPLALEDEDIGSAVLQFAPGDDVDDSVIDVAQDGAVCGHEIIITSRGEGGQPQVAARGFGACAAPPRATRMTPSAAANGHVMEARLLRPVPPRG